jgi:hypothetical protein
MTVQKQSDFEPGQLLLLQQKLELDRLRAAIALVERLRQAGISCEISTDLQTATDATALN